MMKHSSQLIQYQRIKFKKNNQLKKLKKIRVNRVNLLNLQSRS